MDGWPVISEPRLCERFTLTDDEFLTFITGMARSVPARTFDDSLYERALGYPWARPVASYLLSGDLVQPLSELPSQSRDALLSRRADPSGNTAEPRHPLLAFGSNAAPSTLTGKFSELPDDQRELLVLTGEMHDFDVGASPLPTWYGALPATIFPSPGTAVRASLLWVTSAQLTMLAWSELSYSLGRLDGVTFQPDAPGATPVGSVLAFVSRFGALCVDGDVVAMEAVPAQGRTTRSLTQEQLLDHVAETVFGEGAAARELVTRVMEDFGTTALTIAGSLLEGARRFQSDRWTRFVPAPS